MRDELGGKIMKNFVGLRAKTYIYLIDDGSEDKKAKVSKKCVIKRKLKFENYKNCLKATQLENKINHLQKSKTDVDCIKENHKEFMKNNKSILKSQQRFQSESHNVFTEEINKIALSSNDDKRMQSIDLIETYRYRTSKDLVSEKEEIKCNHIIKRYKKMINFDDDTKENIKDCNPNWPQLPDHPYRVLIIGGSGSGKRNSLFNLISQQPNIEKIYLNTKDQYEAKYQFLINKQERTGLKHFNDSKAFIE